MKNTHVWVLAPLLALMASCGNAPQAQESKAPANYAFRIQSLNDSTYPDDPDIGYRASDYRADYFSKGDISPADTAYKIQFFANTGDTITLGDVALDQFIPTLPPAIRKDPYLSSLSLVNQEWNRNQVRFNSSEFASNNPDINRVDVARNCLNAYLWEVIAFNKQDGKELPMAHGWFNFPEKLYAKLFEQYNDTAYSAYRKPLENWVEPARSRVKAAELRTVLDTLPVTWSDSSDVMYPLAGARKKKFKEIIRPFPFQTMRDLQSDSTQFATFAPPGMYSRADPRHTELGRLYHLEGVQALRVKSKIDGDTLDELQFTFRDKAGKRETRLVIGGVDLAQVPVLPVAEVNKGWKAPMGFSNHTFYESYAEHEHCRTKENPYYAYFTDGQGNWLDSHAIGVDGPLMHFTDAARTDLHLWPLSFERHALVGQYVIRFARSPLAPSS